MNIRVEKVLRNVDDKQIGANLYINGVRKPRVSLAELQSMLSAGAVAVNFVLTSNGLRGKGQNLEFAYFLTRAEINKKYPNRCVILKDCVYEMRDGLRGRIIAGVILEVLTRDEYFNSEHHEEYQKPEYGYIRTMPENYRACIGLLTCN